MESAKDFHAQIDLYLLNLEISVFKYHFSAINMTQLLELALHVKLMDKFLLMDNAKKSPMD